MYKKLKKGSMAITKTTLLSAAGSSAVQSLGGDSTPIKNYTTQMRPVGTVLGASATIDSIKSIDVSGSRKSYKSKRRRFYY